MRVLMRHQCLIIDVELLFAIVIVSLAMVPFVFRIFLDKVLERYPGISSGVCPCVFAGLPQRPRNFFAAHARST